MGCAKCSGEMGCSCLTLRRRSRKGKSGPVSLPPSSPRSISHDSQTLENLIELSTRNIAVVEGGVGAIHTYPDFQSDMPVDYIWSPRGEPSVSPSREGREEKFDCGRTPSNNPFSLCIRARKPHLFPPCLPLSLLRTLSHMENTMMEVRPPRDAEPWRTGQARRRRLQSFSLGAINPAWISPHSDSGGGEAADGRECVYIGIR